MRRRVRLRLRLCLLLVIGVLYVVSVPWYRDSSAEPTLWLGLPDWVAVALCCYVAVAVLNALAWWMTDIPECSPADDPRPGPPPGAGARSP